MLASPSAPSSMPPLKITRQDLERLRALIDTVNDGPQGASVELLELELERAEIVDPSQLPANVVSMRSRVVFEEEDTGRRREATLVYPHEADLATHRISVLAPIGMALIGLAVGNSIVWPLPAGRHVRLKIVSVLYQPEAAGEFHL